MKPGSFPAVLRSFAITHYRRMRYLYWFGIPILLGIGVAMRIFIGAIHMVNDHSRAHIHATWLLMDANMYEAFFVFGWAMFSARFILATLLPLPKHFALRALDTDLYPRNVTTLPVKTAWLVLAPILWGIAVPVAVWICFSLLDTVPTNDTHFQRVLPGANLSWAPLVLVAGVVCLNASNWLMAWKQFAGSLLFAATGFLPFAFLFATMAVQTKRIGPGVIEASSIALTLIFIVVALIVASVGRHSGGESVSSGPKEHQPVWITGQSGRTLDLHSPMQSLTWQAFRTGGGYASPIMLVLMSVLIPVGAAVYSGGNGEMTTAACGFVLALPILMSGATRQASFPVLELPKAGPLLANRQWFFVRPITSLGLATAIAIGTSKATALNFAAIAIGSVVWLLLPATLSGHQGTVGGLLLANLSARNVAIGLLLLITFLVALWGLSLDSPISYLSRRLRPAHRYIVRFLTLLFVIEGGMFWFFVPITMTHFPLLARAPQPTDAFTVVLFQLLKLSPALVVAMAVRGVFLWVGVRKAIATRQIPERSMLAGLTIWVVALIAFGTAYSLLLPGIMPAPVFFLYAAMILPLNRLIWPVLTIDAARHS